MTERLTLIPWPTLGAVEAFAFGAPFLVLSVGSVDPWDVVVATIFPFVGCVLLAAQAVFLARRIKRVFMSYLFAFVAAGLVGALALASLNYVNRKLDSKQNQESLLAQEQKSGSTPSSSSTPSPSPSPDEAHNLQQRKEKAYQDLNLKDDPQ